MILLTRVFDSLIISSFFGWLFILCLAYNFAGSLDNNNFFPKIIQIIQSRLHHSGQRYLLKKNLI